MAIRYNNYSAESALMYDKSAKLGCDIILENDPLSDIDS